MIGTSLAMPAGPPTNAPRHHAPRIPTTPDFHPVARPRPSIPTLLHDACLPPLRPLLLHAGRTEGRCAHGPDSRALAACSFNARTARRTVRLGNLRVKKGLLQKDIARVLGRSKSWVGQIENGANQDHRSAKLYAHALGVEFASVVAMAEFTVLRQAEREEMARKLNLDVSPVEDQHDPSKTEH
jgi:transcriptional regulator with XRE-family HTH domain